jgi:uncharacterized protein
MTHETIILKRTRALIIASLVFVPAFGAYSASFDCGKASSFVENAICSNSELSALDDSLSSAYSKALSDTDSSDEIKSSQRSWMKNRNSCQDNACLKKAYSKRINELATEPSSSSPSLIKEPHRQIQGPSAQENSKPQVPFQDDGACPHECCMYGDWVSNVATDVMADSRNNAALAFKVKKGEKVTAVTGFVMTTKPGKAKVKRSTTIGDQQAKEGDIVWLLTYLGEGHFKVWFKGKVVDDLDVLESLDIKTQPDFLWWAKIKNRKGQTGWTEEPENFDQGGC